MLSGLFITFVLLNWILGFGYAPSSIRIHPSISSRVWRTWGGGSQVLPMKYSLEQEGRKSRDRGSSYP